ncbi:MAG: phosphotransferase [Proteobacteria bacterium]|nr:phosphotransferase [Pseudomonadota bacterium]MBU1688873.1 phosphotransferase [Pseudomonadota bacterium]
MSGESLIALSSSEEQVLGRLLTEVGLQGQADCFIPMASDGSDRRFIRIQGLDQSVIAVLPGYLKPNRPEALSGWLLGIHLLAHAVPIPKPLAFDAESGILVCEDLGGISFYDRVIGSWTDQNAVEKLYRQVIDILIPMQVKAGIGLSASVCWDSCNYDRKVMIERESRYFLEACCRNYLGIIDFDQRIETEIEFLAEQAERQPAVYFLHRDFQSRNLMLKEDRIRIIDYQGGRRGPLGYDLASLLIDPYTALSRELQGVLVEYYLDVLPGYLEIDSAAFIEGYRWLSLQRNLQIMGAFAFLSSERHKTFFRKYLVPAADTLCELLLADGGDDFPALSALADQVRDRLRHEG